MRKQVLHIDNLHKSIKKSLRLHGLYLDIFEGELVNLIGLNGCGMEELYRILTGSMKADKGEIHYLEESCKNKDLLPLEKSGGIFRVDKRTVLIPSFTVAENIFLEPDCMLFKQYESKSIMESRAKVALQKFGLDIPPNVRAESLKRSLQQVIRLVQCYERGAKLIVIHDLFEENLQPWVDIVKRILDIFKNEGISILWMNSYPDIFTAISDRVIVIRQGKKVRSFYKGHFLVADILDYLSEFQIKERVRVTKRQKGRIVFAAEGLSTKSIEDISFTCCKGEIVGIYDVSNRFVEEFTAVIAGKAGILKGKIYVDGKGVIPEERRNMEKYKIAVMDGRIGNKRLVPQMPIWENVFLSIMKKTAVRKMILNERVIKHIKNILPGFLEEDIDVDGLPISLHAQAEMSLIFRQMILSSPSVIICFHPTLYLDVKARTKLYQILNEAAKQGIGIIISSADPSTLTPCCDRVLTFTGKTIVDEIQGQDFQ